MPRLRGDSVKYDETPTKARCAFAAEIVKICAFSDGVRRRYSRERRRDLRTASKRAARQSRELWRMPEAKSDGRRLLPYTAKPRLPLSRTRGAVPPRSGGLSGAERIRAGSEGHAVDNASEIICAAAEGCFLICGKRSDDLSVETVLADYAERAEATSSTPYSPCIMVDTVIVVSAPLNMQRQM